MVALAAGQTLAGPHQPFAPSSDGLAASLDTECRQAGGTTVVILDYNRPV